MSLPVPYLPSLGWYRDYAAYRLGRIESAPKLPAHFCRAEVIAPFGRRTLSVPTEGGRKRVGASRYHDLLVSEHGNWRRTHRSTLESAYGSTPYFHFYEDDFRKVYEKRFERIADLFGSLHEVICVAMSLDDTLDWLLANPKAELRERAVADADESLSVVHLLFHKGPATLFSILSRDLRPAWENIGCQVPLE